MPVDIVALDPLDRGIFPEFQESDTALDRSAEPMRQDARGAWAQLSADDRSAVLENLFDMADTAEKATNPGLPSPEFNTHFTDLRLMLEDDRWDKRAFLKLANFADMQNDLPPRLVPYIVLYYEPENDEFCTWTFISNYRAAHGR